MRFTSRIAFRPRIDTPASDNHGQTRTAEPSSVRVSPFSPDAKASVRLRDRWTFLDEPDCPVELHALVGRRISKYHEYTRLYQQLADCKTLDECADVAGQLLDAYLDNQACTRELDYYQKHRRLLGRHPFLSHLQQLFRLRSKTTRQLFEEKKRTLDNIWRAESEIKKGTKPHLDAERRRRIEQYKLKLQEINNLLGDEE